MKLLIGYGNIMRQDDGVGWYIVDQLVPYFDPSKIQGIQVQQLMPEIAATVANATCVVFVDARMNGDPGQVCVQTLMPASTVDDAHTLSAGSLLYLADYLYGHAPPAFLVTITGMCFDLGDTLSHPVRAALPQAIQEIEKLLI